MLVVEADIAVVGVTYEGASALREVGRLLPDVLIADIEMPHLTGLEVAATLKRERSKTRTIIVTTFARLGYLRRAMEAGVAGYLLKDRSSAELATGSGACATANASWTHRSRSMHGTNPTRSTTANAACSGLPPDGLTSAAIGNRLGLSEGTIRNYLSDAIGKIGGTNRVEAARIARDRGWL